MSEPTSEQSIFVQAIALATPAERAAYLDDACRDRPELRAGLDALLAAHDRLGGKLPPTGAERAGPEAAATNDPPASCSSEAAGAVIGPYQLLEPIGEGGMGRVWLAQQTEPVKRLVAVKLIKAGMASKQVIARFEAERQALALMDHAHIAHVLDAGTTSTGQPYFVMDLVKGVPITRYCDEHQLTPRQRLELFIPVCQAVQHAHQKGIIHRDLKPSNVLVALNDGKPVPKVIDFGVAKAVGQTLTEKTLVTGFGNLVGTLEYMSPEQARISELDIDTRSDIYSLGVLLYELLTGSPPFSRTELEKAGMLEMLRLIREQEPSKPSTKLLETLSAERRGRSAASGAAYGKGAARSTLRAQRFYELDWIVMKALEKDRNRRYATANDFAADVQHYLADEPVQACPPSVGYRLRKLARRNKGLLTAAGLVAVTLVAGMVVSTWQAVRAISAEGLAQTRLLAETAARTDADTARQEAVAARQGAEAGRDREHGLRQEAEAAREKSDENLRLALEALDKISISAATEWLPRLSDAGNKDLALVRAALTFYETFAQKNEDDPKVRWEAGRAYWRVGWIYRSVGRLADAEKAYQRAITVLGRLTAETPDNPKYRDYLSSSYLHLGLVLRDADCRPPAEQAFREAVAQRERLVADYPKEHRYRSGLANALGNLANLLLSNRRYDEAEQSLGRSLDLLEQLHTEFPGNREYLGILGRCLAGRGNLLAATDRVEEAERDYLRALGYRAQLAAKSNDRETQYDLVRTCSRLASLMLHRGRFADAERYARQAIAIDQRLTDRYPNVRFYRSALLRDQQYLTDALAKKGKPSDDADVSAGTNGLAAGSSAGSSDADAVALDEQLVPLQKARLGPTHPITLQSMGRLAHHYAKVGRHSDAAKLFEELIPLQKVRYGSHHLGTLSSMDWLASSYAALNRHADAIRLYEETLALKKAHFAPQHDRGNTLWTMGSLAFSYATVGQHAKAIQVYEETLALMKAHLEPQHGNTLLAMSALARSYAAVGRHADAIRLYDESLAGTTSKLGPKHATTLGRMHSLALLLATCPDPSSRDAARAVALAQKTVELDPRNSSLRTTLGVALAAHGKLDEAIASYQKAIEINSKYTLAHTNLGEALRMQQKLDEAIACYRKAMKLNPKSAAAHNGLAWLLATCTDPRLQDSARAVELARIAVKLSPVNHSYWSTLGAALYRAGDRKEAIAALEKSMEVGNGGDSFAWFFLAMAHWQLGEKEKARTWYDRAVLWMDEHQPINEDLRSFRSEAAELLK